MQLFRFVAVLMLACAALAVQAADCFRIAVNSGSVGVVTGPTIEDVCQKYASALNATASGAPENNFTYSVSRAVATFCDVRRSDGAMLYADVSIGQCEAPPDLPPTQAEHCKAQMGKDTTVNWTVGYSRYPAGHAQAYDLVSPPNKVPSDGLMCVAGCKVAAEYGEATSTAYRSASPTAQGTYRLSMDFRATQLGEHCAATQADAPADPKAPIPTCPGNVGEVNGVTVCTGTAEAPVRNDTPGQAPAGAQEGNPAAGPKPSSGEGAGTGGAGRTPSTGDGGPGGGPSGAAGTGKGPDGTTNKPGEGKEQAACGAPGQPKCRIDESGTPDGKGTFDGISKGADEAKKNWTDEIDKWKERKADGWTWTFQLPSGCAPLAMDGYGFQIDVCRFQPVIHDIMSMVWAIATVWGCMLLVFNASGKN